MKPNFHFITAVWGDAFTDLFLKVSLPCQLSPGNLFAFEKGDGSIYKIYTTSNDAEKIKKAPIFSKLGAVIDVEFITTGTILKDAYFQTMINFHKDAIAEADKALAALIFLSPDSLWSDGSFKHLEQLAINGKRVVMVTGTRLTKESFVPDFLNHYRPHDELAVTLGPRDLVKAALPHLHPTTKSLFWNANIFNSWPSVLYWGVQHEGILVRGFHLHPLMVNPEVRGVVPQSSIDDDYINLACPDPKSFHIIDDSDELVGFEISSQTHLVGDVRQYGSDNFDVALWARYYATSQHRRFIKYKIRLHCENLSSKWEKIETESDIAINSVGNWFTKISDFTQYSSYILIPLKPLLMALKKVVRQFKSILVALKNIFKPLKSILVAVKQLFQQGQKSTEQSKASLFMIASEWSVCRLKALFSLFREVLEQRKIDVFWPD